MFLRKRNFFHLCSMTERIITTLEAWDDFEKTILPTLRERWEVMNVINQARRDRAKGLLGDKRIKRILTDYAPERYRFEERVILIEP